MKCNAKKLCLLIVMSTAAGLWTPERSRAQEPNTERRAEAVGKAVQSMQQIQGGQQPAVRQNSPYANDLFNGGWSSISSGREATKVTTAIRKAAETVRDAKGDDAKSAAQKNLADLLNKCYDEDMAQRERELKQIEERLTKLRELLSRRRAKKQDIIDLQTKVALNDADGLGFYDGERSAKGGTPNYYYSPAQPGARPVETNSSLPRVNSSSSSGSSSVNVSRGTLTFGPPIDPTPSPDSEPLSPAASR
jgi:hypothetical protein